MNNETVAGILANLYGDPSDLAFASQEPWIPTVAQLEEAFVDAIRHGYQDAVVAIAVELRRARGEGSPEASPACLFGSSAGLWRLH